MASEAYLEKLRDPRWQKRRLQIFERDGWQCQVCDASDQTLAVHHRWYEKGREPWDYPDDALLTLCEECHREETVARREAEHGVVLGCRYAGFLSGDLVEIGRGFAFMARVDQPMIVAGALEWLLQDPEQLARLVRDYFGMLRERRLKADIRAHVERWARSQTCVPLVPMNQWTSELKEVDWTSVNA